MLQNSPLTTSLHGFYVCIDKLLKMGASYSNATQFHRLRKSPEFKANMNLFTSLFLTTRDIRRLYTVFKCMDMFNTGSITLAELLAYINLPRTAFTEKIFSIFDNDQSGAIDFGEFVLSVWNYCTLTKHNLGKLPYLAKMYFILPFAVIHG